ncbi:MAG: hypothetical protein P8130_16135 [Deltaproteobacteria bacterium]|jgi:hypothetical protein
MNKLMSSGVDDFENDLIIIKNYGERTGLAPYFGTEGAFRGFLPFKQRETPMIPKTGIPRSSSGWRPTYFASKTKSGKR